jgi:hypothetical protein
MIDLVQRCVNPAGSFTPAMAALGTIPWQNIYISVFSTGPVTGWQVFHALRKPVRRPL